MATVPERTKVFISYSHKDTKHLDRLHVFLAPYERDRLLEFWDDTKIDPGTIWREQIEIAIESAKVAILLVSADFLASKFIAEKELPRLLAAAKQEGATILPVILSPCGFDESTLSQFQALNPPTKPLSKMNRNDKDETWLRVARVVYKEIMPLKQLTNDDLSKQKTDTNKTMPSEPKPLPKMNRHEKEAHGDTSITLPSERILPEKIGNQLRVPQELTTLPALSPQVAEEPIESTVNIPAREIVNSEHVTQAAEWTLKLALERRNGHSNAVLAVAANSKYFVSCSMDKTIKLWDIQDGKLIDTLEGHSSAVEAIVLNEQILASGGLDNIIILWDLSTRKKYHTFEGHIGSVISLAISGKTLISGSEDGKVKIWDLNEKQPVDFDITLSSPIYSFAISPDGKMLAIGDIDGKIEIRDLQNRNFHRSLHGHSDAVFSLAFSPDGKMLASGSRDKTIKLWNPNTDINTQLRTLEHSSIVRSVAFSPDGQILASGSEDRKIKLWNPNTSIEPITILNNSGIVRSIAFSPDGQKIVSGVAKKKVVVWERTKRDLNMTSSKIAIPSL